MVDIDKNKIINPIKEYDERGNLIFLKYEENTWIKYKYDINILELK